MFQKLDQALCVIFMARAVFCRSPRTESAENLSARLEKEEAKVRTMLLIILVILCSLFFICKKFAKNTTTPQEIEPVRNASLEAPSEPSASIMSTRDDDLDKERPLNAEIDVKVVEDQKTNEMNSSEKETLDLAIKTEPASPTMLELDAKFLKHIRVGECKQFLGKTFHSPEVFLCRLNRKNILGVKTIDLVKIGWTQQQTNKVAVRVT